MSKKKRKSLSKDDLRRRRIKKEFIEYADPLDVFRAYALDGGCVGLLYGGTSASDDPNPLEGIESEAQEFCTSVTNYLLDVSKDASYFANDDVFDWLRDTFDATNTNNDILANTPGFAPSTFITHRKTSSEHHKLRLKTGVPDEIDLLVFCVLTDKDSIDAVHKAAVLDGCDFEYCFVCNVLMHHKGEFFLNPVTTFALLVEEHGHWRAFEVIALHNAFTKNLLRNGDEDRYARLCANDATNAVATLAMSQVKNVEVKSRSTPKADKWRTASRLSTIERKVIRLASPGTKQSSGKASVSRPRGRGVALHWCRAHLHKFKTKDGYVWHWLERKQRGDPKFGIVRSKYDVGV